jgi:hypothetical protein
VRIAMVHIQIEVIAEKYVFAFTVFSLLEHEGGSNDQGLNFRVSG